VASELAFCVLAAVLRCAVLCCAVLCCVMSAGVFSEDPRMTGGVDVWVPAQAIRVGLRHA
jgi:hypothetical protein